MLAARPVALAPRLAKAAALLGVLLVAVAGGPLLEQALLSTGGPVVQVAPQVGLAPLPGWRLAAVQRGQRPALLTRGSGSLEVRSAATGASAAALAGAYLRERLASISANLVVSGGELVPLDAGLAQRVAYRGQFDAGGRRGALAGEVTALVSPAGTGVVFDAWAADDTYPYERDDVAAMIRHARIG